MSQTQFLMTGKSTKNMNFSNMKAATRTYKMDNSALFAGRKDRCAVSIKVAGREVSIVSFSIANGSLTKLAVSGKPVNPMDMAEATSLAKRAMKIS